MKKFQISNSKFQNPNESVKSKSINTLSFKDLFVIWILSFVICIFITGCEQIDKESIDKIIQEDPSFKDVLVKKDDLDAKINLLLNQFQEAKAAAYANIRTVQENLNKQKQEIDSKIAAFKKELDPQRIKIRQDIDVLANTISAKKGMLRNLDSTKRNLANLISQQKTLNVPSEDMAKWQERLAALDGQIEPLQGEVRELEEKLHVLRLKSMALRQ